MSAYLLELAGLMAVFSFAIVSPGADTAIVLRQSLLHGRRAGIMTSIGVGSALLVHVTYTILGLGLIISKSLLLFSLLKWLGAAYLVYIGYKTLRAPAPDLSEVEKGEAEESMSDLKAFALGFVTNALNPKAVMFFLSLFTALVSEQTPALIKAGYGLVMASCLIGWFAAVSCFLTMPAVRARFSRFGLWINRATGVIFIGLGLRLAALQAR